MEHVEIAVIGGGIVGRLAQFLMPQAEIYDWRAAPQTVRPLTRNYGGNYLWKPIPGIPCRTFRVVTHIDGMPATPDGIRRYKAKIGKEYESSQSNNWHQQFQPEMSGWDFTELPNTRIQYGCRVVSVDLIAHRLTIAGREPIQYRSLISSIPLYSLCSLAGIREPNGRFQFKPIYVRIVNHPPDAKFSGTDIWYVNYLSDMAITAYRYTDRNEERHYESLIPMAGYPSTQLKPGKIYANPYTDEIIEYLAGFHVYPFGRYGAWRPDELVHETWEELQSWKQKMKL